MMNENYTIFIFGAPGAGKGVSAQILKEKYNFKHLSMGECLRQKIFSHDAEMISYKNLIDNGQGLVPCKVVNKIYSDFTDLYHKYNRIIDGYPRTIEQLEFLEKYHKERKNNDNVLFVFFEADTELLVRRLLSRETCTQCLHDYIFEAVNNPGICNLCNGKLIRGQLTMRHLSEKEFRYLTILQEKHSQR